VTQLYRELFPPGGCVLDLMSGSLSHLPPEVSYERVVGLGLNLEDLAQNPRLDAFVVQNLNVDPRLPFDSGEFHAAGICQSIDFLAYPVEVLREVGRVLQPGASLAITHAEQPAVAQQVIHWLRVAGNWQDIRVLDRVVRPLDVDPLFAVVATACVA
jgi:SAM-dependent methyltransferase